MRVYANLLAQHSIRVNSVHPTGVDTPMINNDFTRRWLAEMAAESTSPPDMGNAMPVEVLQPEDIANAVAWLVSDHARYITGITLPVDAGFLNKVSWREIRRRKRLSARWCWSPSNKANRPAGGWWTTIWRCGSCRRRLGGW